MEVVVHLFEMAQDVDEKGYYVLKNHTLTTLLFREVRELEMNGLNEQNVLFDLLIENISSLQKKRMCFDVTFDSVFGVDMTFKCADVEVSSVIPYEPPPASVYHQDMNDPAQPLQSTKEKSCH